MNNLLKKEFDAFSERVLPLIVIIDYIVSSVFTFFHFLIPDFLNSFNIRIVSVFSILSLQVALNSNYQVVSVLFFILGVFSPLLKITTAILLKKKRMSANVMLILTYSLEVLSLIVSYTWFICNSNYTIKSLLLGIYAIVYNFIFIISAINRIKKLTPNSVILDKKDN